MSTIVNTLFTTETASAEILAAATIDGERIKICSLIISASAASSIKFKTVDGSGDDISQVFYMAANSTVIIPFDYNGWFETGANEALYATITGTVNMSITIKYRTGV